MRRVQSEGNQGHPSLRHLGEKAPLRLGLYGGPLGARHGG